MEEGFICDFSGNILLNLSENHSVCYFKEIDVFTIFILMKSPVFCNTKYKKVPIYPPFTQLAVCI